MKILFLLLMLTCFLLLPAVAVQAETTAPSSPEWEISVLPKPTAAELEQQRWTYVFANDIGIYAFDNKSITIDEKDKNLMHVLVKTIFSDPKTIEKLNEQYKNKLGEADKVSYSEMQMVFQVKKKEYAVTATQVVSEQGLILRNTTQEARFLPVPVKTFADSMYEIVKAYKQN